PGGRSRTACAAGAPGILEAAVPAAPNAVRPPPHPCADVRRPVFTTRRRPRFGAVRARGPWNNKHPVRTRRDPNHRVPYTALSVRAAAPVPPGTAPSPASAGLPRVPGRPAGPRPLPHGARPRGTARPVDGAGPCGRPRETAAPAGRRSFGAVRGGRFRPGARPGSAAGAAGVLAVAAVGLAAAAALAAVAGAPLAAALPAVAALAGEPSAPVPVEPAAAVAAPARSAAPAPRALRLRRLDPRLPGGLPGPGDLAQQLVAGVDQVLLDLHAGVAEQPAGHPALVRLDQRDDPAGLPRPGGAPAAVQVVLVAGGQVDVDHHVDAVDVDAAGGDVGGDQRLDPALAELGQRPNTHAL